MKLRSYLYVSGDNADRLAKASTRGADALIIDLEDGVAKGRKSLARENLRDWLTTQDGSKIILVRVNVQELESDLEVAVHQYVRGIILPKSQNVFELDRVTSLLSKYEAIRSVSPLEIVALIETAEGVLNAPSIAQHPRVARLILGELDLRADLSIPHGSNGETIHFARNQILYASAAAKIDQPVASVSTNFKDLDRFLASTREYADWGYFGRTCIHPDQVPIVNEVFSPSKEELEWAKQILEKLNHEISGSSVDSRGEMIDEAVAKTARRILGINQH